MNKVKIGIVGATGLVGKTMIKLLDEYKIEFSELRLFASIKSVGKVIHYKGSDYIIHEIDEESFIGLDYVLFATNENVSSLYIPLALKSNATVIDNSSFYRLKKDIPLVIPEINIEKAYNSKLIASPNCATIQSCILLNILKKYQIKRISYSTYQSVSGIGHKGVNDLIRCRKGLVPLYFKMDIACSCIPLIGELLDNGFSTEEEKMANESRKILDLPDIPILATCVRVPVMFGHGVSVQVELENEFDVERICEEFNLLDGVVVCDNVLPSSILATKSDYIYVGRIRKDEKTNTLLFYCVADNVRKGAASNVIQILAKLIMKRGEVNG